MQTTRKGILLALVMLIAAGYPATAGAAEDDTSCYLEASVDVFVAVWNVDDEGNKGYLLWKGVVKPGKPKLETSQAETAPPLAYPRKPPAINTAVLTAGRIRRSR